MRRKFLLLLLMLALGAPWAAWAQTTIFTDGFENSTSGWSITAASGNSNYVWARKQGTGYSTSSYNTAGTGSYNVGAYYGGSVSGYTYLTLDMSLSGYSNLAISFQYINPKWSSDIDYIYLEATTDGSSWSTVSSYTSDHSSWTTVSNQALPNGTKYIRFAGKGNYGYGIGLDAVTITGIPGPTPTTMQCGTTYSGTLGTSGYWGDGTSYPYSINSGWGDGAEACYAYTPDESGSYTITTTTTSGDPDFYVLSEYDPSTAMVAWSSDNKTVTLEAGHTYYIIADNYYTSSNSGYTISISCPVIQGVPYSEDFEGTHGWQFANGTCTNYWTQGSDGAHGGSNGLYITNGSGNAYSGSSCVVYAYKRINFASTGTYTLSYDLRQQGESTWDCVGALLYTTVPSNNSYGSSGYTNWPSGYSLVIGGAGITESAGEWVTITQTFTVSTAGVYYLVIAWKNDGSGGSNPPASIDNVNVVSGACYSVSVSATPSDGGTVSGGGLYASGSSVTVSASASSGFQFASWTENGTIVSTSASYTFTMGSSGRNLVASFMTTPATVPYTETFESTHRWQFANGSCTNYWTEGSAGAHNGSHGLYITNGSGNSYSNGSVSIVYAYKPIQFTTAREYNLSFDLRQQGEGSGWDCVGAMLYTSIPSATTSYTSYGYTNWPSGYALLIGGAGLDESNGEWVTISKNFTLETAGTYYLVIAWKNDGGGGSNPPASIDNVVVQNGPLYSINVSANPSGYGTVSGGGVYANGASATVSASAASGYYFANWTVNGEVVSTSSSYTFTVSGECTLVANFVDESPVSVPYTETFESSAWKVANGSYTNYWARVQNVGMCGGSYGMFITNDGANNSYDNGSSSTVFTYKTITFDESTTYSITFNWRAYGESSSYDYITVGLVPATETITAGSTPSGWTNLNGCSNLNLQSTWQKKTVNQSITAGTYKLVFKWWNDSSGGSNPPAAIDNVVVKKAYTITASTSGNGVVTGAGTYPSGQPCSVVASPGSCTKFVNWTENGSVVSTDRVYSFTLSANRNLVANFETWTVDANTGNVNTECLASGTSMTLTAGTNLPTTPSGLAGYGFQTGVDASRWYSVTSTTNLITQNSNSSWDYGYSSVQTMPEDFTFPFGGTNYTQFSVNADGNLRLGSTVTGTSYYNTPFSSSNASYDNPKINGMGFDGYFDTSNYGNYVHAQLFGSSPNRVFVVEFYESPYSTTTRPNPWKWQVQLFENGDVQIVYSSDEPQRFSYTNQIGMSLSASDIWLVNPVTHTPTHYTSGTSVNNPIQDAWPGASRYYRFTAPAVPTYEWTPSGTSGSANGNVYTVSPTQNSRYTVNVTYDGCTQSDYVDVTVNPAAPTNLQYSNVGLNTATVSWSGSASNYQYNYNGSWQSTSSTSVNLTGLTPGQTYTFRVKAVDGNCESSEATATFTTLNTHNVTVSANPNNGGTASGGGTITHGTNCTVTATPATGWHFVSWTEGSTTVSNSASYTFTVNADHNLVANFEQTNYTLTIYYKYRDESQAANTSTQTYHYGDSYTVNSPTITGYTPTQATVNGSMPADDVTVTVYYDINTYTVSIVSNNTDYGSVSTGSISNVPYGTAITTSGNQLTINGTTVTATAETSDAQYTYAFSGWSGVPNPATVTGAITITANFTQTVNTYTVSFEPNDNSYGTVSPTSVTVPYGSTFTVSDNTLTVDNTTVTATPAQSTAQYTYAFDSWSGIPQSVTGDVTVTANFTATTNAYTVTIVPNDGTYGTVSTGSVANVPYGTTLSTSGNTLTVGSTTVTATPETNTAQYTYGFSDWTSGGSSVPATVTGDITITANFTRTTNEYTVTVVCNNDNYGTVSTGSIANVPYGTAIATSGTTLTVNGITVTATPETNTAQYTYTFDGWTGVPSPAEVTGDVTITANFTQTTNAYTVTIVPNDANYGSVSPTSVADVPYGTTVSTSDNTLTIGNTTVTATPETATAEYTYAFSGWSNAPQSITDDVTITANFTQTANPYTLTVNYEYSDGTEAATTHTETVAYNATYTVTSPTITGYTASQAVVSGTMPAHNETVTVTYTINSYTITLVAGANGSVSGGGTYTYGATCNATANPDNGFALENWTENGVEVSTANPYSFTVTGDRTLTANFMVAPPVVTLVGIDPHVTTVDASGTVDANGHSIGEAGFVWSTTDFTPTVNGLPSGTSYVSTSTIVSGAFSATTTTPMAANTMYYMRAYVRSGSNYYYSDASTYYTLVEVTTEAESDLHTVDVTFNGSYATGGNGHVSGMGFVYSTTATTPTIGGSGCTQVSLESPYSTPFSANVDGLEGNTDYYVCAYVTNEGGTSYGLPVHFTTDRYYAVSVIVAPAAGGEVTFSPEGDGDGELTNEATIGEGTVEQTYFPILPTAAKSFCEMIYPHTSEMVEGNITKISFHNKSSNGDIDHNVRVYLLNTSATTMTNAGVTVTETDVYYEGRMACDAGGWAEINLTTPFAYDGTSNLMVGVYYYGKNVTSENGAARTWYATTQTDNCSMVYYGANVNPLTLTGTKQLSKNLPNMKVEFSLANGETEWYHYGYDAVTLTAVAKPGYGFVNWTENGSQVSANATYTLTNITADHSLTANFELLYKRFVVDGNWNVSGSWLPAGVPTATDNVSIEAHATIPSGVVAEVDEIVNIAADTASLKIADGGQLRHNNASNDEVTVTIEKYVEGYTDEHYYDNYIYTLYSSPANVSAADFRQYTYGFDDPHQNFFYFDYANTVDGELLEWVNNYTYGANDTVASLVRNRGYLYASMHSTTLGVTGEVMASDVDQEVNLAYTADSDLRFNGWNLMGNPFVCNAYVAAVDANGAAAEANYYVLNSDGNDFTLPSSNYIEPAGAMMVRAYATGDKLLYSRDAINLNNRTGMLDVAVAYDGGHNDRGVRNIDRARVRFGEGRNFEKLQLDPSHTCVYIPVSGNDYSVVYAQPVGVIPVNFRAEHNGAYTLSFGTDGVTFNYLHLIDNMTGADVDLLTHDSYSFNARMTDYESRFKLVFATNEVGEGDGSGSGNFAFNMNGTWVVYSDGEATLQVVDVLGHILSSERISGTVSKAIQAAPGVYMLRLIQGENVNVQKIVIER